MKKNRKRIAMVLTPGFLYRFFNRFLRKMYLGILTGMVVILTQPGFTAEINLKTAETIARNFITYLGEDYTIGKTEPVEKSGQMVGYLTNLTPHGYILVAGNTIRIPIKAYSLSSNFDNLPPGYVQTLLNELQIQAPLSSRSTFAYTPSTTPPEETNHAYWDFLGGNPVVLRKTYTYTPDTRLVTTTWNQGYPYNKFTPKLGGESTLTGCTQTALAQVMRYHGHPSSGSGVFNHA